MISSCEHRTKHSDCLNQFLIYSGRDFDSASLAALRRLDLEAAAKGFCPLVELHHRLTTEHAFVEKKAFDCINSNNLPTACPIHGIEGEAHCSCLEKFIAERENSLTPSQILQVRRWMRTSADPRSCALLQLCDLYGEEMELFLADEDCDCDRDCEQEVKGDKKEKKLQEKKKRKERKAADRPNFHRAEKKTKPRMPKRKTKMSRASKRNNEMSRASIEIRLDPEQEAEALPVFEVDAVASKSKDVYVYPEVAVMKEKKQSLSSKSVEIKPPKVEWKASSVKTWESSSARLALNIPSHTATSFEIDFDVASQSQGGEKRDLAPIKRLPPKDYSTDAKISPPLTEYVKRGPSDAQHTLATIREAPEEATVAEAFEPKRDRAEATSERVETIVRVDEMIREDEEGELEEVAELEEAVVVAEKEEKKQQPEVKVEETVVDQETNEFIDAKADSIPTADCDCECDCVQRENLLVLRMEKVLKKFIISLRNKDRKDFKKYYKTVMQSLDATFQTKTFCELRLEEVVFLLSCDDLSVETEDRVFDMIIHWIAIDVATRRGHIFELLKCVRLIYVKKSQVTRMLENSIAADDLTTRRYALLHGALAFKEYSRENQINYLKAFKDYFIIPKKRGRKDPVSIVETMKTLLGGKFCACVPEMKSKFPLTVNMTHPFLFLTTDGCTVSTQAHLDVNAETGRDHSIAFPDLNVKEDVITIVGGVCPDHKYGREAGFHVFCLNPFTVTWDCLTRLPAPRHHHGVARVNGILYVIGGDDVGKAEARRNGTSKDVFAYDPASDTWWACPPLSVPRSHHSVTVAYGLIYVCGGLDDEDRVLDSMEVFSPETCSWSVGISMAVGRAGHACCIHNDSLWVMGGFGNARRKEDERQALRSVEIYDIKRDRWRVGPPLRYARCHGVSASLDGRLHLAGGAAWTMQAGRTDIAMTSTSDVDVLNEELQSWYQIGNLNIKRQEFASFTQGDHLRVFGGLSSDDNRTTQTCEIVNLKKASSTPWGPAIPIPVAGAKSLKLSVPLHRLEKKGWMTR